MNGRLIWVFLYLFTVGCTLTGNVALDGSNSTALFDIQITIPEDYDSVKSGEDLLVDIKLVNLGGAGREDVYLDFWIEDMDHTLLLSKKETVAVETQANFVRTFKIPETTKPGTYEIFVKLTYADNRQALASQSFEVIKNDDVQQPAGNFPHFNFYLLWIVIIMLILLLVLFIYIEYHHHKETKALIRRISEEDLLKHGLIKRR